MTDSKYDRLITFASVHHAIRAEVLLRRCDIATLLVPTPREIDISCGQCLLFFMSDQQQVLSLLREGTLQWSKLFDCSIPRVYHLIATYGG